MSEVKQFRKKPVVIEALWYRGANFQEVESFVGGDADFRDGQLVVATLEGPLHASSGDWIIKGIKGEFYPCKPDIFEATYEPVSEMMTFGQAIELLKRGFKVARKGWNGKNMFLWLKPAAEIKAEWCKDGMLKELCDNNGGSINALGTVCMFTHDSTGRKAILTRWLASQSDMLLEDWAIVQ